ncbi:MAG: TetR family transcriptional regulator, partial [bacterium]|nr:TetR family transcriptional regulator [bacterium]
MTAAIRVFAEKPFEGARIADIVREARMSSRSFYQFFEVVDLRLNNRRVLESLIKCGGFDSFGHQRSQLWSVLDRAMESGQRKQADLLKGQHSLFGDAGDADEQWPDEAEKMPEVEEWPESERLSYEKELLGYFVTGHPLNHYTELISHFATTGSRGLAAA